MAARLDVNERVVVEKAGYGGEEIKWNNRWDLINRRDAGDIDVGSIVQDMVTLFVLMGERKESRSEVTVVILRKNGTW